MQRLLSVRATLSTLVLVALASAACSPPPVTPHDGGVDVPTTGHDVQPGGPDTVGTDVVNLPDHGMVASCGGSLGPCNPVTNDGCTGANTCVIVADGDGGTTSMCAAAGTVGYGATCVSANDCVSGFSCLGSTCTKLCCGVGDDDRCNVMGHSNGVCNQPLSFTPGMTSSIFACTLTTNCDWFAQNCPSGQSCAPISMDGTTSCTPAGTATAGMPCATTACARGTFCVMAAGSSTATCGQICDPTGGTDGGAGHSCSDSSMQCAPVTGLPRTFGVCVAGADGGA